MALTKEKLTVLHVTYDSVTFCVGAIGGQQEDGNYNFYQGDDYSVGDYYGCIGKDEILSIIFREIKETERHWGKSGINSIKELEKLIFE